MQGRISHVEPTEYPRLVEVWEAAVRQTHHFLTEDDIAFFKPLVRDEFLYVVELVAMCNEEGLITGFAGVAQQKLEMLFVDPSWHGKGIGRHLLEYSVQHMGATTVDVNEQNEQATGFYLKMGAEVIGRSERDSLGKPFPLLHMRLPPLEQE